MVSINKNYEADKNKYVPYTMISLEARSDLHDPLIFFKFLEITHFYRKTLWEKITSAGGKVVRYNNPFDLMFKLKKVSPGIVQGVEPFALLPLPFIFQILRYVKKYKLPLVVVSLENIPFRKKYGPVVTLLATPLLRLYIKRASLLIAINEGARQNFLSFGAAPNKIVKLMYGCWGVDLSEYSPNGPVATIDNCKINPVILFVGRLVKAKGIFVLVEAFSILIKKDRSIRLVFVGDGADSEELKQLVKIKNLSDKVIFLGAVPNYQIPALMRRASILVAPSITTPRWAEQVGMVLLQAIACGKPVVSTTSGSIPEFVENNKTGLLVPENNIELLEQAIYTLLNDSPLYRYISSNVRNEAIKRFDAKENIRSAEKVILNYVQDLLGCVQ